MNNLVCTVLKKIAFYEAVLRRTLYTIFQPGKIETEENLNALKVKPVDYNYPITIF